MKNFTTLLMILISSVIFAQNSSPRTMEKHRIWIDLLTNTNNAVNQMLLGYMTGATNGFDPGIDGSFINDSQTALNSYLIGGEYAIQGRALPFTDQDVVPLIFKTTTAGNFGIVAEYFDGLFLGNQDIFIKDNQSGTIQSIKTTPYTFSTEIGVFNQRFQIIFSSLLGVTSPSIDKQNVVVYKQSNVLTVDAGINKISKIKLFDIQGRQLIEKDLNSESKFVITNINEENQILILQITLDDQTIVNKKVIF